MDQGRFWNGLTRLAQILIFILPIQSYADLSKESSEVVEASPVDIFSERSGVWNSTHISTDSLQPEARPLFESLGTIPGVQSKSEGSPTISIRGSQSLPRVLGLYNGIPLNTGDGNGANQYLIPAETLEDIRIIKGPASIFWGSDAMGGAANFIMKKHLSPTVRGNVGSFGERGIFAATPLLNRKKNFVQVTAYNENLDGEYPYTLNSTGQTGARHFDDRHLQRYSLFGEQELNRVLLSQNIIWSQFIGDTPGSVTVPNGITSNRVSSALGSAEANYFVGDNFEAAYRIFTIRADSEFGSPFGQSYTKANKIGNSLTLKKVFNPTLTSEVFYDNNHDEFSQTFAGDRTYVSTDSETGALFDIQTSDTIVIKTGARYLVTYQKIVPAIGVFDEQNNLKRWITYSEGFHAPSLQQRFSTFGLNAGNPNLNPESSKQTETGFLQKYFVAPERPWEKFEIGVSVFQTSFKDFITTEKLPDNTTRPNNIGSAQNYGVEATSSYYSDIINVSASYSYLKTEDQNHNPLPLAPDNQFSLILGHQWAALLFELTDTYWGRFYDRDSNSNLIELKSWNTVDFSVRTVDFYDWSVKAGVLNIFDVSRELSLGYPEVQRRFWASIEKRF